jgi:type I restriction enzyme R subunit
VNGEGQTRFINGLDPDPRTRTISANLPHIHRPETLAESIGVETLDAWVKRLHTEGSGLHTAAEDTKPSSLRGRITTMPPVEPGIHYANQIEAVTNLEHSLKRNHPWARIQMATGSGKTIAALTAILANKNQLAFVRYSPEVLKSFRSSRIGWQARMDE